jgi:RNA polymerase sigma-70 factor (ECF subfamily)
MQDLQDETDQALWRQVQLSGNREAFELLYRRHMRVLYNVIYKCIANAAQTEDLLQDVFLDLWEKRQEIHIEKKIFPYLYSIARFKLLDHLRKQQLTGRRLQAWQQVIQPTSEEPAAFSGAGYRQQEQLLEREVTALSPQLQRVYQLSCLQGKSISETADILSISPHTVKNHLQKLRKHFRKAVLQLTAAGVFLLFIPFPANRHTTGRMSSLVMLCKY